MHPKCKPKAFAVNSAPIILRLHMKCPFVSAQICFTTSQEKRMYKIWNTLHIIAIMNIWRCVAIIFLSFHLFLCRPRGNMWSVNWIFNPFTSTIAPETRRAVFRQVLYSNRRNERQKQSHTSERPLKQLRRSSWVFVFGNGRKRLRSALFIQLAIATPHPSVFWRQPNQINEHN